ncbi:hypothetical protein ACEQ8H_006691 [Pleosporales sp. CAS-2024a]
MSFQLPQNPVSPLASPSIHVTRPEYASVPGRSSDESNEVRRDHKSRFQENINSKFGIQMLPMATSKTPSTMHNQDLMTKPGLYSSPNFPTGARPLFSRTPDTLYSYGSGISRSRTDPMTERLIAYRATQSARWHIHWRTPTLILFSFFMGIVFALCQHFLYQWLHHRGDIDEVKKFRFVLYGRALAYGSKLAFGGCVVLVYRQRMWRTFRDRALSVLSIDQFFGATEDPSIFGNWEAISSAPLVVAIAMIIWLIPLATIIFAPGALTFDSYLVKESIELMVPTINFTAETEKSWRSPVKLPDGSNKRSVIYYNTTSRDAQAPEMFDYYDQPSAEVVRIALLFAYNSQDRPNVRPSARQDACGGAYNCTFEHSFIGPGYQCTVVAKGVNDTGRLKELGAPFDTSILVPTGSEVYHGKVDLGDYARPQNAEFEKGPGGYPVGPVPDDLGVFKSEPVLWIGWSYNTSQPLASDDPLTLNWTHLYEPQIARCVHMETEYKVRWDFVEPSFHTTVSRNFIKPVVDTDITIFANGTQNLAVEAQPVSNQVSPRTDVPNYKRTAASHALGEKLRFFLDRHVDLEAPKPGPYYATVYSDITKTRLVQKNSEPKPNLTEEIESFYTDMVLSLLSAPEMLVASRELVMVNRTRYQSSFVYMPERLWQCYAPVIFCSLLVLLFGAFTILQDGSTFSTGFSRILVTTRNTTLDDISRGACLGNDPFPMELMRTRLKFGVLNGHTELEYYGSEGPASVGHCAFGVASEIGPIRRGVPYAGLKKRNLRSEVGKDND